MTRSPCATCEHGQRSKHARRCADCGRRLNYLAMIERAPECRQDPCYAAAYVLPRPIARRIGPAMPFSQMDLMLMF